MSRWVGDMDPGWYCNNGPLVGGGGGGGGGALHMYLIGWFVIIKFPSVLMEHLP